MLLHELFVYVSEASNHVISDPLNLLNILDEFIKLVHTGDAVRIDRALKLIELHLYIDDLLADQVAHGSLLKHSELLRKRFNLRP